MIQTIHLNSNSFRLFPLVYMVQNDTGRELEMILDDFTLSGSETGTVAIKRSDGSYYSITATIDAASNSFTAEMDQALTQPGYTDCQLKVTDSNDDVISSYTFRIMVQPSTDGVPEEQLGYSIQDLMEAAQQIIGSGGLTPAIKDALLNCFSHLVWADEHGQEYYDALELAMYPPANLVSISAVYTQSETVYDNGSLDDLKDDLVVTANYDNGTTEVIGAYTLSGNLTAGTSTITVTYAEKTTTFTVEVTHAIPAERTVTMASLMDTDYTGRRFNSAELEPSGTYANMVISHYVSLNPGSTVVFTGMQYPNAIAVDVIYYNYAKDTVMGSANLVYGRNTLTVPEGAYFMRFNMGTSETNSVTYTPYEE